MEFGECPKDYACECELCCRTWKPFQKALKYEFEIVQRVVQYSFQSRLDGGSNEVWLGPSKYEFWGSNDYDCSKTETRVTLIEDNSGTPFTLENIPKCRTRQNLSSFRGYEF
ncbi:unnamed protein product, partial [Meganyctiphanes norvegica]